MCDVRALSLPSVDSLGYLFCCTSVYELQRNLESGHFYTNGDRRESVIIAVDEEPVAVVLPRTVGSFVASHFLRVIRSFYREAAFAEEETPFK
jgi:hypothetical protein